MWCWPQGRRPGSPSWRPSPRCAWGRTLRGSARAWWLGGPRDSPCLWLPSRGLSPFQELHLVNLGSAFAQRRGRAALLVWQLLAVQQLHLGQRSGCEAVELQVPGRGRVHAPLLKRQPGKAEVGGQVTLNPGWCSRAWLGLAGWVWKSRAAPSQAMGPAGNKRAEETSCTEPGQAVPHLCNFGVCSHSSREMFKGIWRESYCLWHAGTWV